MTASIERKIRCRRIVTVKSPGRSTAAKVGPPAHERCSQEVANPNSESKLCSEHLAAALRDLLATGAIHLGAQCDREADRDRMVADLLAAASAGGAA